MIKLILKKNKNDFFLNLFLENRKEKIEKNEKVKTKKRLDRILKRRKNERTVRKRERDKER